MLWRIGGRKLFIARFRRVGDRKIHSWEQWHRDGQTARVAFKKALEREFPAGFVLLSSRSATVAEQKKILGGHPLSNPVDLLSAAMIGATAGATSAFVRKRLEQTAAGQNPAFAGKPGERFAACGREMKGRAAAGRKRAANPYRVLSVDALGRRTAVGPIHPTKKAATTRAGQLKRAYPLLSYEVVPVAKANPSTGYSIAMVPRKGPRLLLPRVFASKAEAQQRARKLRRPYGTRTAVVPVARNPYDAAAAASEGFHGRPAEETIKTVTPEHHHEHLAALGQLVKLEVLAPDSTRDVIPLQGFKGTWLAMNENRNQLFVHGGDQSLTNDRLRQFGIDLATLHETEVLGPLAAVTYYTVKYHLGEEGGDANYRHVFGEEGGTLPVLIYQVRDGLVKIAGGSYTIPDEGVTN